MASKIDTFKWAMATEGLVGKYFIEYESDEAITTSNRHE